MSKNISWRPLTPLLASPIYPPDETQTEGSPVKARDREPRDTACNKVAPFESAPDELERNPMTFMILKNGKPVREAIAKRIATFDSREDAQKFADNYRALFDLTPRNFSNTRRIGRYEIVEMAA